MSIAERRMKLFDIIKTEKTIQLNKIADLFCVSSMTIRRDLQFLERQGLVILTHGGAILNEVTEIEPSFVDKLKNNIQSKNEIAEEAASYINNGDTIILDCGTTVLQMLKYIQHKKIRLFTNSYPVCQHLIGNNKIEIFMAPGQYSELSAGFFGLYTINFFNELYVDKVFIGTHGFDYEYGASVPDMLDAQTKKSLLRAGKQKYLLFEETKVGNIYQNIFATEIEFNKIITR
ncbi:hypothetical protein AN639_04270 [Candidatus Epulonipiscium fishelsonii]|uniref:Uncharacterized protein n=1 Tax=Candidatus Epulonipiscium fishelsonii TaxID=77094 RepID=A0ACC8XFH4_9FIRM|nr:hypothetical protein AN639_04270 [Epulopiscium sp. SCG-B05WGA-EpuloA1]ONI42107.1 hypothetical protein AN396_02450 [Epulopiscium sp. SCG-B11WGA-EpuloA1]